MLEEDLAGVPGQLAQGRLHDLTALAQHAFAQLATRIATEANRLWADDWDIDAIIITGGGGATLAPFLQPQIEGEVLAVPADQDTRLHNAAGYWKYGVHLWAGGGGWAITSCSRRSAAAAWASFTRRAKLAWIGSSP